MFLAACERIWAFIFGPGASGALPEMNDAARLWDTSTSERPNRRIILVDFEAEMKEYK